jgi:hypothetical protein
MHQGLLFLLTYLISDVHPRTPRLEIWIWGFDWDSLVKKPATLLGQYNACQGIILPYQTPPDA